MKRLARCTSIALTVIAAATGVLAQQGGAVAADVNPPVLKVNDAIELKGTRTAVCRMLRGLEPGDSASEASTAKLPTGSIAPNGSQVSPIRRPSGKLKS